MLFRSYNDAKDKIEKAEEKQADIAYQLAKAKRAEDISAVTAGINSEQHVKDQNHTMALAKLNAVNSTNLANQKTIIEAYDAVGKHGLYGAEAYAKMGEGDWYRSGKDADAKGMFTQEQLAKEYQNYQMGGVGYKNLKRGLSMPEFAAILRASFAKNPNPGALPSMTSGQFVTDPKTGNLTYVPSQQ